MLSYLRVIQFALLNFPLIAVLFTMPFLLVQYKKYGAVPLLRTAVVYSFILYCMTVYFLTVFPLPKIKVVAAMTTPTYCLTPFAGLAELVQNYALNHSFGSVLWVLITSAVMREHIFNVLMFLPLGVYLRYYFKCNWWQTLLLGFLGTLFLELTQLSGLYGIYPRPYRLFDVADLVNNTLGALVGYWVAPLFCRFLPSRNALDAQAYRKGEKVPILRRLFAFAIDWVMLGFFLGCVHLFLFLWRANLGFLRFSWILFYGAAFLYFVVLQWLCGGRTFGKSVVRLRMVRTDSTKPRLWQLFLHYFLLFCVLVPSPFYMLYFSAKLVDTGFAVPTWKSLVGVVFFGAVFLMFCIETLMKLLGSKNEYFFGRLCRTYVISTIVPPQEIGESAFIPTT